MDAKWLDFLILFSLALVKQLLLKRATSSGCCNTSSQHKLGVFEAGEGTNLVS